MAWSRRSLLRAGVAAGLSAPGWSRATGASAPTLLVTVVAEGGWDVTHCLDPKPGVDTIDGPELASGAPGHHEVVETYADGISVAVNPKKRPSVDRWFRRWASRAHVVNGIWMGAISHDPCRFRILTGTPLGTNPALATIFGHVFGAAEPLGSLDLSRWSLSGPLAASTGRVGYQNQIKALIDPHTVVPPPDGVDWSYPLFGMAGEDADAASSWLRARAEAYGARADGGRTRAKVDDLLQSWSRAERLREGSAEVLAPLVPGRQAGIDVQVPIAVDLLESGLCRAVTIDSGSNWDTHDDNTLQHAAYELLFDQLEVLASLLDEKGLLDHTLVAVVSEMTRTPRLNSVGGKDHWPHTSALFFGGGVRGGVTSGATDDLLESVPVELETGAPSPRGELLRYDNLAAGVLEVLGIDPGDWLPGVTPFRGLRPA